MRIDSIHVTKSESYGFFGEPGASAEWNMTITVNDQSRTWTNDDVRDGRDYNIGWDFVVDLPNSSATVSVRSSGFEDDLTSANDPLPSAEQTHGSADNWGVGATRQLAASSADFDYSISYTVSCLQQLDVSVISRQEVLRTVQARLSARGSRSERSESDLLSVFISKMMARGMRFRGIDSDLLTWEGPASIHRVAAEAFPTTAPGDGKS